MGELQVSGDMLVYLLGLAATWGTMMWRLSALEKKVDKHNQLVERMAVLENKADALHERVDIIERAHPRVGRS